MAIESKKIIVHGWVQGVGFRYFVQRIGTRLGLVGNVCNCPDSTVEILVEGDSPHIAEFIKNIQRGPTMARVERLEIQDMPVSGKYTLFLIEGW